MKVNEEDKTTLSDSIDKLSEGLDVIIQLYNEVEEDVDIIEFEKDVIEMIGHAKKIYGSNEIDQKINRLVKEFFSLLPPANEDEGLK